MHTFQLRPSSTSAAAVAYSMRCLAARGITTSTRSPTLSCIVALRRSMLRYHRWRRTHATLRTSRRVTWPNVRSGAQMAISWSNWGGRRSRPMGSSSGRSCWSASRPFIEQTCARPYIASAFAPHEAAIAPPASACSTIGSRRSADGAASSVAWSPCCRETVCNEPSSVAVAVGGTTVRAARAEPCAAATGTWMPRCASRCGGVTALGTR
mmetsp:Transcript_68400/g.187458  ORF Transcript_68400/g.187458 Transcript_68400/m.187458 type:complete len:210 (-) Transcript_68400:572-1201(-)